MTEPELLLRLVVAEAEAEIAADALWGEGATAVEWRQEGPEVVLLAGYPTPEATRLVAERWGAGIEPVAPGWSEGWRKWAEPVEAGPVVVAPAWRPVPISDDRLVIEIDPGECFGSGTHPSTRMLLSWLGDHPPSSLRVLDVGTGSGILAVAAARLGAASVTAVDIDPAAAAVVGANARRNGVEAQIRFSDAALGARPPGSADLVLINVTAGTHAGLGPHASSVLVPGGTLALAGLLPGQWQHVAGAYGALRLERLLHLDGWEGAILTRQPDPAPRPGPPRAGAG